MARAINRLDSLGPVISPCIQAFARDSCASNGDQGDETAGTHDENRWSTRTCRSAWP